MTTGASCASSQSELGRLAVFLTIDGNRGVGAQGEVDANVVVVDGAGVVEEVAPQSVGGRTRQLSRKDVRGDSSNNSETPTFGCRIALAR